MYIMTILTTKWNGVDMVKIEDIEIDGFRYEDDKFKYIKWCKANELENDEYRKQYLIGLREGK